MPDSLFKVIEPTRLTIISLLKAQGELTPSKLLQNFNMTPSALSQHLRILENVGIVKSRRDGSFKKYKIVQIKIDELNKMINASLTGQSNISARDREEDLS